MATLEYNQPANTSDSLNIGSFKILKGQFNYDHFETLREDETAEVCFWVRHSADDDTAYSAFNTVNEVEALKAHKQQTIDSGVDEEDLTDYDEAITEAEALVAKFG